MTEPHGIEYAALRRRVQELVRSVDPRALEATVPATPNWTGLGLLSHMVGVTNDVANGRLEGIATDAWTGAQVDARRGRSVDELLDEWDEYSPGFEALVAAAPEEIAGQALFDGATHEQDLRHALDRPGARDGEAMALGWEWILGVRTRAGSPAIRLITEFGEEVAGAGEPVATVTASRFELLRACTGRRSVDEIARYVWDPKPDPELLLAAAIFRLRDEPLDE